MKDLTKGPIILMRLAKIGVVCAVIAGLFFLNKCYTLVDPKDMVGIYKCEGFGLPDPTYPRLWITPEMILKGVADGKEFFVGRLAPHDQGLELEYSMETVHFSSFNLDPFTAPRIFGYKNSLSITAKKDGKEFTVSCPRF